jgi:ketosteroid isomerase-like protein
MEQVWLKSARVHCTHPGWRRLVGYAAVMDSWQRIFENTFEMSFHLTGVEIAVVGDLAWVVCTENITSRTYDGISRSQVEATNVFERHDGRWRLVHHHGSPVVEPGSEEPSPRLQ